MANLAEFLFGVDHEQEERAQRLDVALSQIDYMAIQFVIMQAQLTRMEHVMMGGSDAVDPVIPDSTPDASDTTSPVVPDENPDNE